MATKMAFSDLLNARRWDATCILGFVVAMAFIVQQAQAVVVPPNGSYAGRTYNEWEVLWWQQLLTIPVVGGDHPLINGGPFGGQDGVLFLTGVGGGTVFDLTVTADTALFFPIINVACDDLEPPPFFGATEPERRACANGHMDAVSGLFANLDGMAAVPDLSMFRFESPEFIVGPLPPDNLFQFFGITAPPGTTTLAVAAGYYLLLEPLGIGPHELHFGATNSSIPFSIDTTYRINVIPEPSAVAIAFTGLVALLAFPRRREQSRIFSPSEGAKTSL